MLEQRYIPRLNQDKDLNTSYHNSIYRVTPFRKLF